MKTQIQRKNTINDKISFNEENPLYYFAELKIFNGKFLSALDASRFIITCKAIHKIGLENFLFLGLPESAEVHWLPLQRLFLNVLRNRADGNHAIITESFRATYNGTPPESCLPFIIRLRRLSLFSILVLSCGVVTFAIWKFKRSEKENNECSDSDDSAETPDNRKLWSPTVTPSDGSAGESTSCDAGILAICFMLIISGITIFIFAIIYHSITPNGLYVTVTATTP